ncbi:GNAT family N-acetyltransferase [Shewanella sp. OMA3-2]|uniref:GNAT family N-acetyltransferase n=1 Tax=Shewanella sp. OMA3-2 TaxID=2908650 RepID=UPI001F464ED4|nr:GNAT family N-acetyltransferase [Shewanella sp. OMA3-2]UJF21584.1 GNAT family N-acetyltransferase [Shewanella sp. OMA3-2]
MKIRQITVKDWPAIMAIQASCYHDINPESLEVMQSKWQRSPQSCLVLEHHNQIVAYILCHPWLKGDAPKLNTILTVVNDTQSLYIHDMAVSPAAQGLGIAKQLVNHIILTSVELGFFGIGLVAIQGAGEFWQRFGFKPLTDISPTLLTSLASYNHDACYLFLETQSE